MSVGERIFFPNRWSDCFGQLLKKVQLMRAKASAICTPLLATLFNFCASDGVSYHTFKFFFVATLTPRPPDSLVTPPLTS